jgi:hypothetical protein
MNVLTKPIVICIAALSILSCRDDRQSADRSPIASALLRCENEFNIKGLSYLIVENGRMTGEYAREGSRSPDATTLQAVEAHFAAPLLLEKMIRDSIIRPQDSIDQWLQAKDMVRIPADYYERNAGLPDLMTTGPPDLMTTRIQALVHEHMGGGRHTTPAVPRALLPERGAGDIQGLFHRLWGISAYFDETYPEYSFQSGAISNVFPGWYTQGLSVFFGWYILKFQGQTVLWNYFTDGPQAVLCMKLIERSSLILVSYSTAEFISPTDLHKKDLLQSPLALAVLKKAYTSLPDIDYRQPVDSLETMLARNKDPSYDFIYLHDLLAHARLYDQTGRKAHADSLYRLQARLMKDSLLVRYENKPVLAEINYVPDNLHAAAPFALAKPSLLQVFAAGQVRIPHDYKENAYVYDNVQLFINDHSADPGNSWLNTHLLQFNYGLDKIGNAGGICAFGDPSDTSYILEARIDWKTLNPDRHRPGRTLSANVLAGDCDLYEDRRENILSWSVGPAENFADEKKYGTLILAMRPGPDTARKLYVIHTAHAPAIDGKMEKEWGRAPWSSITLPYQHPVSAADHSGRFKALFDDRYLYLLFEITDNCKNRIGIVTMDKCWIENADNGLVVWKMMGDTTENFPSCAEEKKLFLPAGHYLLKYSSDKGHSYEHWYGRPPANGQYGGAVYATEK